MQAEADADVMGVLKGLYLKQLKERLGTLEQAMIALKLGQADASRYKTLEFEVHRLNGTGATYGFPSISKAADTLEDHLRTGPRDPRKVTRLLNALITAIAETLKEAAKNAPVHDAVAIGAPPGGRAAPKPTVLIADDDPAILSLVSQLISSWTNVECVESGQEAIRAIERRRYDLVILDYELPDMTGLEVLTRISQADGDNRSPVMMLTAMREPFQVSCLIAAGAQHYMIKPLVPHQLVERVAIVLSRQKRTIMVADDDPLIREIFRKRFTQRGYQVTLASNGTQALNMARKSHPQVIVLDRQMPRMDGIQVLQELRREEETRPIPVVMLSALARSDDMYSGYREGADAYIPKPFLPDQVIDCCEGLLRPLDASAQVASVKASWENSAFV